MQFPCKVVRVCQDYLSTPFRLSGDNRPSLNFARWPQNNTRGDLRATDVQPDSSELFLTVHLQVACDREDDGGRAALPAKDREEESMIAQ